MGWHPEIFLNTSLGPFQCGPDEAKPSAQQMPQAVVEGLGLGFLGHGSVCSRLGYHL